MLERTGPWLHRHHRAVLCLWAVLVVAGAVLGGSVFDRAEDVGPRAGAESTVVAERLDQLETEGEHVLVVLSGTDPLAPTITLDGEDVAEAIRSAETTAAVSPVATVPAVRERLLELQRAIISTALAEGGIVVEGRDIGSVVAPEAEVKVYLTADPAARAARRRAGAGEDSTTATEEALLRRDRIDSTRATAPLTMPEGAVHIDTTPFTLDEVIDQVVALVDAARERE